MTFLHGLLLLACAGVVSDGAQQYANIGIVRDFVRDYPSAETANSDSASASFRETIGGVTRSAIFLHPGAAGEATVTYRGVAVPGGESATFLFFSTGIREGIPWESPTTPNGVRFSVQINGERVFSDDLAASVWRSHALDLSPWSGQSVDMVFSTDAIDGRSDYDWSVWGDPMLVTLSPVADALTDKTAGIAFAQVDLPAADTVTLTMGAQKQSFALSAGKHWLPLEFASLRRFEYASASGGGEVKTVWMGAYGYALQVEDFALSSPLVLAEEPFGTVLKIKNIGRGYFSGDTPLRLAASRMTGESEAEISLPGEKKLDALKPGESASVIWRGIRVPSCGHYLMSLSIPDAALKGATPPKALLFHAFPPVPESFTGKVEPQADGTRFTGIITHAAQRMRLKVIEDTDRETYLIAEVRVNGEYRRAGSLYPLADAAFNVRSQDGTVRTERATLHMREGDIFAGYAEARGTLAGNDVRVTFTPDPGHGRVRMRSEFTAATALELLHFQGPSVLAGDRSYGAAKDFAVFGGLEYLEGAEESSSERDLAYPLNLRRVPAPHKLGSPVMAVQGQDTLMGLLWEPRQEWAPGQRMPAAWFDAPKPEGGVDMVRMSLFAPSVGNYVRENTTDAEMPYRMRAGEKVVVESWLVLDSAEGAWGPDILRGPHRSGLLLGAYAHLFDLYGLPEPTVQPRSWQAEKELLLQGYDKVWGGDPPGFSHCQGWAKGLHVGQLTPLLVMRPEMEDSARQTETDHRAALLVDLALRERGPHYLWSNAGCHIMLGELPYHEGCVSESLKDFVRDAAGLTAQREDGLWRWRPGDAKTAALGRTGDHTLAQAAWPLFRMLRAARLSGNPGLAADALAAMGQMSLYEVPRGAQTWECPLYQPDILAAAQAIRACTEAYRLTGDPSHLAQARYWAWTGIPFLYLWDMDGFPTMRYNAISVMGSTFYTHSWIGLPVVWCGLVYAYALQDLAEFDASFDWKRVAQGITNSAMWQQYTQGASAGCYPDSWDMVKNRPNPADIGPENILANELRLRGLSPEPGFARVQTAAGTVMINSAAQIAATEGSPEQKWLRLVLRGKSEQIFYTSVAQVEPPVKVTGSGERQDSGPLLRAAKEGWQYDPQMRLLVLKISPASEETGVGIEW